MPIYEFVCAKCGHEFEEIVTGEGDNEICPKCGACDTHRVMSVCARHQGGKGASTGAASGGGCGSCSGGNCASCGR